MSRRVASTELPETIRNRVEVGMLVRILADESDTLEVLAAAAGEAGVSPSPQQSAEALFGLIRPHLSPATENGLFAALRRTYDRILDERLLEDRTSRPIVLPPQFGSQDDPSAGATQGDGGDGDVVAYVRTLIDGARFSVGRAARELPNQRYLRRSVRQLLEASDWISLLRDDPTGDDVAVHELVREFEETRDLIVGLLSEHAGQPR